MGIGARIRDWGNQQAEEWGERLGIFAGNVFGRGSREAYDEMPPELRQALQQALDAILEHSGSGTLRELLASDIDLKDVGKNPGSPISSGKLADNEMLLQALSQVGSLIGAPLGLFPIVMDVYSAGYGELYKNMARQIYEPARLDPALYIAAEHRRAIDSKKLAKDMGDLGLSKERTDQLREALRPLLDPATVRELCWRFPEGAPIYLNQLQRAGYDEDNINALEKLYEVIPGVQDLIRMAVREVFTPDIVEEFGQMQDFPPDFAEWASKQGVSETWARNYWAAHWDLPGISQAFDMHHRTTLEPTSFSGEAIGKDAGRDYYKVIDGPHLNMLLRALDVMPAWRDKLTRIAYRPLTRVDVRRMHAQGTLSADGVTRAYLDHGYSDEHADLMTEFTIKYNTSDDRDLTATEILKAYRRKTIDRDTALELLQEIGYGEDEADFKLIAEDAGTSDAERTLSEAKLKALYLAGIMPKLEATAELQAKRYDAKEIEHIFTLWDLESAPADKLPTRGELSHFLAEGILTETEFYTWMERIGYPDVHIDWYIEEHIADQATAARKEEEAALAEAERIERSTVKTDYMTARARLDVKIAEVKVFIADARRSLLDIGTDAERAALRKINLLQSRDLARLSLEARQAIASLTLELRIAARGVSPEEKAILELASLADRQYIESMTLAEREAVTILGLAERKAVRAEVSELRSSLRKDIAAAGADIARLKVDKASLKL